MRSFILIVITVSILLTAVFADTYSELPSADTWIWSGSGPWGSNWTLRTNIVSSFDQEIVIRFDLSSIPAGSTINSAVLSAYRYDGDSPTALECDIYRVTEDWFEATLVDAIAHDTSVSYDQIIITGTDWYDFDIALLVQDWVDGSVDNFGIVFYGTGGTGSYQYFRSRESNVDRPHLDIDYSPPGSLEGDTFGGIKATFPQ
jgi:hypothetical protein